ncbi:MAG TPA: ABC transporter substrate-binding protein [Candidatus Avacidaminococcus intestinavium]|uniref:ABC transporter substrate-binding protein n=1 Tax=Candidatus Avacidaminococcus intestinavium TaxID=2840684 RepID=A0A9D1SKI8_9FIRM|nr:ABC transporter substrate-binding protein [Candidatus Avacidaminococcus intestinavium]
MKKTWILGLIILSILFLGGCSTEKNTQQKMGQDIFLQVTDDAGRSVTIKNKPQRIVCLSPSFFTLVEAVDGKLVGRASSNVGNIPDALVNVPEVGFSYNVDTERIIALNPDGIIALEGQHNNLVKLFEANNIPVLLLNVKTYDEVKSKIHLFGQIFSQTEKSKVLEEKLDAQIKDIVEKTPYENKKIVILHASAKNVTVELEHSIAGSVAKILGFTNVAAKEILTEKADKMPYSLEDLVKYNPDVIFITSMGTMESVESRLQKDVKGNPAWGALPAVQNGRVFVLPEQLFLVNPGIQYPDAVRYMAKTVYPEVFANE